MNSPEAIFQREKLDAFRPKNDTENWTERLVLRFNELALRRIHSETKRGFNALLDSCLNAQQKLQSFEEDVDRRGLRRDQFPSGDDDTKKASKVVQNPFEAADRVEDELGKIDACLRDMKNGSFDADMSRFQKDVPQEFKDKVEKILSTNADKGWVPRALSVDGEREVGEARTSGV